MKKDLLAVSDLAPKDIDNILKRAAALKKTLGQGKARPTLKGKTLGMIFEKSSTRTRVSFEVGIFELGEPPGELVHIAYDVSNRTDRDIVGQAIPDYAPRVAGRYFKKLECFCFARQTLHANETRRMPVVFVVDPGLPADVHTITLSYTFFEISNGVTADSRS